jgi:hypothetical protein
MFNFTERDNDTFEMPRATWTVEPTDANTTTVFMMPEGIGTVKYDGSYFYGIDLNTKVAASAEEVSILIQVPKNDLKTVNVGQVLDTDPFKVNIAKGFTKLVNLYVDAPSVCDYYDGCPTCNTLYTSDELKGIGPTIFADLSSVEVFESGSESTNSSNMTTWNWTYPISIIQSGPGVYDLTLVLPNEEDGVGMSVNLEPSEANIKIKGNLKCEGFGGDDLMQVEYFCSIRGKAESGVEATSASFVIEGSITGNIYTLVEEGNEVTIDISEESGCDNFEKFNGTESTGAVICKAGSDASVEVDGEPMPCVGENGMLECVGNWYYYGTGSCRVPLDERECPEDTQTGSASALRTPFFSILVAVAIWIL